MYKLRIISLLLLLISTQLYAARPAVVRVEAQERASSSLGTGTCIATTGSQSLIVTAWHVIRDATGNITVTFPDVNEIYFVNKDTVSDKNWDTALLVIPKGNMPTIRLANKPPDVGMPLTIAGYGSGTYREATGIVKKFFSPGNNYPSDILAIDAPARSGDSGGPMFYMGGTVAAVLFGSDSLGAHGSHCVRVRQFIKTSLNAYPTLQQEALKIPEDYLLYGFDNDE